MYLPPLQETIQKYLRDILIGWKQYISCKKVNVINVPHYKGLTVQDLLSFAELNVNIYDYLLEYEYNKAPNRVWLWNVINNLIPTEFKSLIEKNRQREKAKLNKITKFVLNSKARVYDFVQKLVVSIISKRNKPLLS